MTDTTTYMARLRAERAVSRLLVEAMESDLGVASGDIGRDAEGHVLSATVFSGGEVVVERVTPCCGSDVKFIDIGEPEEALACRGCYELMPSSYLVRRSVEDVVAEA